MPWLVRLEAALGVQHLQNGRPDRALGEEVIAGVGAVFDEAPAFLLLPLVGQIVLRAQLGIAQDAVRFGDQAEAAFAACFLVVRVKALGEQPVDAVDGLRLGVHADL